MFPQPRISGVCMIASGKGCYQHLSETQLMCYLPGRNLYIASRFIPPA